MCGLVLALVSARCSTAASPKVGVQEAVLRLFQLETDAGGTTSVLFRRDGAEWRPVYRIGQRFTSNFPHLSDGRGANALYIDYGESFEMAEF